MMFMMLNHYQDEEIVCSIINRVLVKLLKYTNKLYKESVRKKVTIVIIFIGIMN